MSVYFLAMTLIIDDDILAAARISVEQVRLELAVALFQTTG